ncbi:MAG: glycine--tRNA ligase subunit beta [Steroidobacteraceae bacterium]
MRARDFLVEIGTEELPPGSLAALSAAFAEGLGSALTGASLTHGDIEPFATPRRLALVVKRLAARQADQKIARKGPPVTAAFDANGQPTRAALAFAESCGVHLDQLGRVEEPKGVFLHYAGVKPGLPAAEVLPGLVQQALDRLPIARRMRWGAGEAEFVRPVHWVVMLHGQQVIDCALFGIQASDRSRGHRFHAPGEIKVTPTTYEGRLESVGKVVASAARRRKLILDGVSSLAAELGGTALLPGDLLDEVTALVEWPVPVAGRFEESFLRLPEEVVIATVRDHQRYFPVRDADGRLTSHFITVSNIESRDPAQVRAGNERVVRPRLSDAAFFWDSDLKRSLAERREELAAVTYHRKLGSQLQRTRRVEALAEQLAAATGADPAVARRAAELAKCDLLTAMVGEFPELQGTMGRYYAAAGGEAPEVASALEEQYLPRFAGDRLPATPAGSSLALADRLDTLVGIFAAGEKPTGTKDPYGLRRAALGLLRILIEQRIEVDLVSLIDTALSAVRADMRLGEGSADIVVTTGTFRALPETDPVAAEVYDYVMERLRGYYVETAPALSGDLLDAVLARRPGSPLDLDTRLHALSAFVALPEAASLTAANKRIANLLRKADDDIPPRVDASLLEDPAERALAVALEGLRPEVEALLEARSYDAALRRLASLRPAVDAFFDGVMVMAESTAVRRNRLGLLAIIERLFVRVGDLSRLQA